VILIAYRSRSGRARVPIAGPGICMSTMSFASPVAGLPRGALPLPESSGVTKTWSPSTTTPRGSREKMVIDFATLKEGTSMTSTTPEPAQVT
jgi:hypothetical protein